MKDKLLEELLKELLKVVKVKAGESAEEVLKIIKEHLSDAISLENIKEAWNLEEIKTEELSLEKCISLVKKEFNQKLHSSACILNKKDIDGKYKFEIHICFLDKNNEPMLKGNAKHWIVYTNKLDSSLLNQFAGKDMILLK
ncbi:hypothetical protein EPJ79_00530 [Brachyspira aalborgi]|uniref:Uncharacterized protein n=1 Tax=Brachyspira aalborgi TaxID=29522 RepID=A0A5C8D2J3_9SPIR|nr:hypothetical protein [Brachyspira aalborgi]TXJ19677.1 hypothetical protein EPJ79_00530 [Brachyspira aalborgi]